jgi:ABC-type branched-subunit amino acid transport system substrate-binding protein
MTLPYSTAFKNLWLVAGIFLLAVSCAPTKQPPQPAIAGPEKEYRPAAPLKTAEDLLAQGQNTEALYALQTFLERYPHAEKADRALLKIIQIYNSMGNHEQVLAEGERFMSQYQESPSRFTVLLLMTRASAMKNRTEQARQQVAEAATLAQTVKEQDEIQAALAFLDQREGQFESAMERLVRLHKQQEETRKRWSEEKIQQLAQAMNDEQLEGLLKLYSARFPEELILWELGRRAAERENLEKAEAWLSRLIKEYPSGLNVAAARELLEQVQKRLGRWFHEIACILPLSGPHEIYGRRLLFGLQLGFGVYTPTSDRISFRLIVRDSRGMPAVAEQQVRDLAAQEKVIAVVGPLLTSSARVAAKEAQKLKLPIITLAQGGKITDIGDYVFRHFITARMQIQTIVQYASAEQKITRFAVFHPANDYGRTYTALFSDEVARHGGQIVAVRSYDPHQTDFRQAVKTLIEAGSVGLYASESRGNGTQPAVNFQALFIPDDYRAILLIAPQLAYFDIQNVKLLGTNLWNSPSLVEKAGTYVQGAIFPDAYCLASQDPEAVSFRNRFREVFGEEPDVLSALAFDTAGMVIEAIRQTNASNREEVKNALRSLRNYRGVTGLTSFTENGDVEKSLFLLTVQGQKIVPLLRETSPSSPPEAAPSGAVVNP